ncbi:CGNR zinc finger domain-containing protein [Streptomyces roseicoloratus]|uniref:CGNR zinc finger domain-containing protein n=1 Tax=Streptomyces roseicoloratus TaxID=2508722 RepID=A0ABY9RN86_9ACTN|nr:CGNR zinc finger domain-containing protein [Streptomyces roseicoloratus]WMX43653.1 CGNR zinc finger domain-containing protein [Streptomyces roseicoloratus]
MLANALRAADLVNVLGRPGPDSAVLAETARVLRAYGESEPLGLSATDLPGLREAAAELRPVFAAAGTDAAAHALNALLAARTGPLRLTSHGGTSPWHPHVDGDDDAPWAEWFLASSCLALAVLLWDRGRAPGGVCASTACQDVFVPQGAKERRYCSRRCATRERVAAHRRGGADAVAPVSRRGSRPGP